MTTPSFSSFPAFDTFPEPPKANAPAQKYEVTEDRPRKKARKHKEDRERDGGDPTRKNTSRTTTRTTQSTREDDERAHKRLHSNKGQGSEDIVSQNTAPLFFIDRRGDPLNIQYGRPHSGDVPRYRWVGGGRNILGLSNALTVVGRSTRGVEVGVGSRKRMPELTDPATRKRLTAGPSKRIGPSAGSKYKYEEIAGFIRLPAGLNPENRAQAHRSIEKDNSDSDSSAPDEVQEEESDEDEDIILPAAQERMRELERQVKANPTSISTWLALLKQSLNTSTEPINNAIQARSEITIAILGRAMSSHPLNNASLQLRLLYIRAGELVWPAARLHSEWDTALRTVKSADMVMEWLDWRIRTGKEGPDGLVQDGVRAMGLIQGEEVARLRVLFRIAIAMKDAGYVERASAMFQAQAEMTFALPQALIGMPFKARLEEFETFWDAEVPRLGEDGAKGWVNWDESAEGTPSTAVTVHPDSAHDLHTRWAEAELFADRSNHLAQRKTEDPDADPYATVLLSDIAPLLSSLSTPNSKDTFRKLWITFCGLHLPGFIASLSTVGSLDDRWSAPVTNPDQLISLFPSTGTSRMLITAESHAGVVIGAEPSYNGLAVDLPVREWTPGVSEPWDLQTSSGPTMPWQASHVAHLPSNLISNILKSCRLGAEDEEWDSITLAFEAALSPKRAIKLSKTYLAAAQNSAARWNVHARLERSRGKVDEARKIYETVLAETSHVSKDEGAASLWWNWAEMEWLASHSDAAMRVILRSVGITDSANHSLLRARGALEDSIARSSSDLQAHTSWIKLRALLELLASDNAEAMLDTFDMKYDCLDGSIQGEHLMLASCMLFFHHARTLGRPSRPAVLRERAAAGLTKYPNNTLLLGLFLESDRGQAIWGRSRQLLGSSPQDGEKSVLRRVAEVWAAGWNRNRWPAEVERVRSALNASVSEGATRGSPVMWRIYLEFEIRVGELKKAKKALYRAVAECPMYKELYLLAFTSLRKVFKERELEDLVETMAERGIRLRTGLDEALANWSSSGHAGTIKDVAENDYGEEDIEKNADDMRRLRPY